MKTRSESGVCDDHMREGSTVVGFQLRQLGTPHGGRSSKVEPLGLPLLSLIGLYKQASKFGSG